MGAAGGPDASDQQDNCHRAETAPRLHFRPRGVLLPAHTWHQSDEADTGGASCQTCSRAARTSLQPGRFLCRRCIRLSDKPQGETARKSVYELRIRRTGRCLRDIVVERMNQAMSTVLSGAAWQRCRVPLHAKSARHGPAADARAHRRDRCGFRKSVARISGTHIPPSTVVTARSAGLRRGCKAFLSTMT